MEKILIKIYKQKTYLEIPLNLALIHVHQEETLDY